MFSHVLKILLLIFNKIVKFNQSFYLKFSNKNFDKMNTPINCNSIKSEVNNAFFKNYKFIRTNKIHNFQLHR